MRKARGAKSQAPSQETPRNRIVTPIATTIGGQARSMTSARAAARERAVSLPAGPPLAGSSLWVWFAFATLVPIVCGRLNPHSNQGGSLSRPIMSS